MRSRLVRRAALSLAGAAALIAVSAQTALADEYHYTPMDSSGCGYVTQVRDDGSSLTMWYTDNGSWGFFGPCPGSY